jgi:hypothetical protein
MFEMKLQVSDQELDLMDALSDEDLVSLIRNSLTAHRASRATEDEPVAGDPSTAAHGGRSVSTLETSASRSANDAARAAARRRANDLTLSAADRAAARLVANDYEAQSRRDAAHAKIVPGIDRL